MEEGHSKCTCAYDGGGDVNFCQFGGAYILIE